MLLIFPLGRSDVSPHDDLGVRPAIRDRYQLSALPDKKTSSTVAAPWRPYASVASWYCWRVLDLARNTQTVATGCPSQVGVGTTAIVARSSSVRLTLWLILRAKRWKSW